MRIGVSCFGDGLGQTGGIQIYQRELLRALERYGASGNQYVLVFHPTDDVPPIGGSRCLSVVKLEWPPGGPPRSWRKRLRKLRQLVPKLRPPADSFSPQIDRLGLDLIHYPATTMDELSLKTPVVLTFFDMQEEFLPEFFPLRERLGRRARHRPAVEKASLVIAPSSFTARSLETVYGTPAAKICCVPVGIREEFNQLVRAGERERLAAKYGLPVVDFLFFPANPWPHKNHARLFSALHRLNGRGCTRHPVVCTGTLQTEKRSVRTLAAAAGLGADQVYDLGFVEEEDMPALYRSARMLIFPSLFEGYGIPVLEAMACGCPVACSDTSSLPEIGGDAVRYFDPRNEGAILEAMQEVWEDGGPRSTFVERGLSRAAGYRWDKVVPMVLRAYARAAEQSRGR